MQFGTCTKNLGLEFRTWGLEFEHWGWPKQFYWGPDGSDSSLFLNAHNLTTSACFPPCPIIEFSLTVVAHGLKPAMKMPCCVAGYRSASPTWPCCIAGLKSVTLLPSWIAGWESASPQRANNHCDGHQAEPGG
eukprot:scaffold7008_cov17-Tisochrysis_lutea.AAC.1